MTAGFGTQTTPKGFFSNFENDPTRAQRNIEIADNYAWEQWAWDQIASFGLTYAHKGGVVALGGTPTRIPDGTVELDDNATNYVQRDLVGFVSVNQVGFDADQSPMAVVETVDGAILSVQDWRLPGGGAVSGEFDGEIDASQVTSGVLPLARGGTGHGSNALGDLLVGTGVNWMRKAAAVAGFVLLSSGVVTPGVPAWGLVTNDHVAAGAGIEVAKLEPGLDHQLLETSTLGVPQWITNIQYANLPTGGGTWANGGSLALTVSTGALVVGEDPGINVAGTDVIRAGHDAVNTGFILGASRTGGVGGHAQMFLISASGSLASPGAVDASVSLGSYKVRAHNGVSYATVGTIAWTSTELHSAVGRGTASQFQITPTGTIVAAQMFSASGTATTRLNSFFSDLTTASISGTVAVNAGTGAGANNQNSVFQWHRGTVALWQAGVLGAVAANSDWTLRDVTNGVNAITVAQGAAPATTFGGTGSFALSVAATGAAGTSRDILIRTGGLNRIGLRGSSTAEGGADTGTNFQLNVYNDAGTFVETALSIARVAAGSISFLSTRSVSMGPLTATTGTFSDAISGDTTLQIDGNTLLGTTSAATGAPRLDIVGTAIPQIIVANVITDATTKAGGMGIRHYTNSEEPVAAFGGSSTITDNFIAFGGGNAAMNAATNISFWTAANNTTTTGTSRLTINSAGLVTATAGLTVSSGTTNVGALVSTSTVTAISFAGSAGDIVFSTATGSANRSFRAQNLQAFGTNTVSFEAEMLNAASSVTKFGSMRVTSTGTGAGSEEGTLDLRVITGGALTTKASVSGTGLEVSTELRTPQIDTVGATNLLIQANNTTILTLTNGGGVQVGAPTGGDKGAGTLNATAVYDDNVLLTDYVFEAHHVGSPWTRSAPDGWRLRTLDEIEEYVGLWNHLPGSTKAGEPKRSLGQNTNFLTEKLEEAYLHLFDLNRRLSAVESLLVTA